MISAEADQVVPVAEVGHELRAAGLGRGDHGGVDPHRDVVVGDPGDADHDRAPARPRSAPRTPGPGRGRGSPAWPSAWTPWTPSGRTAVRRRRGPGATLVGMSAGIPREGRRAAGPEPSAPCAVRGAGAGGGSARPPSSCSCGALFVVSAANSEGTDLRPGRYTDLAVARRRPRPTSTTPSSERVADLERRGRPTLDRVGERPRRQPLPAPGRAARGPGRPDPAHRAGRHRHAVRRPRGRHQLHDQRPQPARRAPAGHPGGRQRACGRAAPPRSPSRASGSSSTTGIKCEGNSVQLQGVPYPQPYVISGRRRPGASCSPRSRTTTTSSSTATQADDPDISVGWDLELEDAVTAPAYDGLLDLSYAEPLR